MDDIQYIGEHLFIGKIGHFAVILTFVMAALSAVAYFLATQRRERAEFAGWRRIGRGAYLLHTVGVFGISGILFVLMINQFYEYEYVWKHVSPDLPMQYIFSAFWEGQEGSFLLWMIWHAVLGIILMRTARRWESPVMSILSLVQFLIASMLLGVYFGPEFKIGSNPFLLLRDTMDAPIFRNADYLSLIEGNGLNPLLQNYWMTIHPPTLFLGFASVTIPFCFAAAGLWVQEPKAWLRPALPWALFSGGILGLGILMGGAWAYEALSFGGYWAWDPVENMSLVPWLILIAGIHSNLIAKSTGYSIRATYLFYFLSFVLILYSTFLTRSGVLGDTSVHAFTQMGLEWQLIILIAVFTLLGAWLFFSRYRSVPVPKKEESIQSREFWMFIGTLVLLFSAALITFTTSIPVYNKLFDFAAGILGTDFTHLHRTAPVDPITHYNKYQLWIAVLVALLSGAAQFLRYREMNWGKFMKKFLMHVVISGILAAALYFALKAWIEVYAWQYHVLLVAAAYGIVANIEYAFTFLRHNVKQSASVLAHLGFAMMLVGIMASGLNKRTISSNPFAQAGLVSSVDPGRNITLIKGKPMFMHNYWVEYKRDTIYGNTRKFVLDFARINDNQDTVERFTLTPNVLYNKPKSKVEASNPDTKHYLDKDIFTYIHALPAEQMDIEQARIIEDSLKYVRFEIQAGDTVRTGSHTLVLQGVSPALAHPDYTFQANDLPLGVRIIAWRNGSSERHEAVLSTALRGSLVYRYPNRINPLNMRLRLVDESISRYYAHAQKQDDTSFNLQRGQSFNYGGYTITLEELKRNPNGLEYTEQDGDIAVQAVLSVQGKGIKSLVRPLFLIRGNQNMPVRTRLEEAGLQFRFTGIDPASEVFSFGVAEIDEEPLLIPFEIAEGAPRDDIIVLEAIEFPGINLFWSGSLLMLVGLFLGMAVKLQSRKRR